MLLRLLPFFCFLFFLFQTKAQSKGFHLGASANFTSTWIINQNNFGTLDGFNNRFAQGSELDYTITLGGGLGIDAGYNFSRRHGIQASLIYDKCGQKYHGTIYQETEDRSDNFPVEVKRNVKLNYIKLPLLYKFELVPKRRSLSKKINYYFAVGPQIGALLSVYEEVKIDYPGIPNNLAGVPESEKFRNIDVGLVLQNGLQYRVNKNTYLNAALNLYVGLIDINGATIRDLAYFSDNDVDYKPSHNFHASLNVGIHYLFVSKGYY